MAVKSRTDRGINLTTIMLILMFVLILVGGFFGYRQYDEVDRLERENERLSNPQEAAKTDLEKTKSEINNLIILPSDEEPTIANVVDKTKLEGQQFFVNAENGDKLLLYQNAKKAILYRPSINKIVEVSTINVTDDAQNTQESNDKNSSSSKTNLREDQPGLQP